MSDKNYVLIDCPACGTEHRIHKIRTRNSLIKCKNCKCLFFVTPPQRMAADADI